MNRVSVIDIPGLSRELLQYVPTDSTLGRWIAEQPVCDLEPTWPAVTCSMQATLTTGKPPSQHGIIANGVATFRSETDRGLIDASNFASYRRNVSFWEQSNQFIDCPRFWQNERGESRYKTALLFFQNSMPGFSGTPRPAADVVLTPKPDHGPDGKLTSLCWSAPADLVGKLFAEFGPFPLMNYWGPLAGISSSQWIAKAAARVWEHEHPRLQFTYIPHLDYDLQRYGPASAQAKQAVRDLAHAVEPLLQVTLQRGTRIVVLSEYAISPVTRSIQPNLLLREAGLLSVRDNEIDYAESAAFMMVDHQIGHLFCRVEEAVPVLEAAGLETVSMAESRHRRSGDVMMQAPKGAWLDYRWWDSEANEPSFARMVDIHRKPGYDPLELFMNFQTREIARDASSIRGSHGRTDESGGVFVGLDVESIRGSDVAVRLQSLLEKF